jgi:hypothetical protein
VIAHSLKRGWTPVLIVKTSVVIDLHDAKIKKQYIRLLHDLGLSFAYFQEKYFTYRFFDKWEESGYLFPEKMSVVGKTIVDTITIDFERHKKEVSERMIVGDSPEAEQAAIAASVHYVPAPSGDGGAGGLAVNLFFS